MRPTLFAAVLALVPALGSVPALAAPKAKQPHPMVDGTGGPTGKASVCGVKVFPLAVGNSWTYSMIPAP
ncbi:MAG: hypothetical protein ABI678_23080, partial [Kofleriaceae bacterium]